MSQTIKNELGEIICKLDLDQYRTLINSVPIFKLNPDEARINNIYLGNIQNTRIALKTLFILIDKRNKQKEVRVSFGKKRCGSKYGYSCIHLFNRELELALKLMSTLFFELDADNQRKIKQCAHQYGYLQLCDYLTSNMDLVLYKTFYFNKCDYTAWYKFYFYHDGHLFYTDGYDLYVYNAQTNTRKTLVIDLMIKSCNYVINNKQLYIFILDIPYKYVYKWIPLNENVELVENMDISLTEQEFTIEEKSVYVCDNSYGQSIYIQGVSKVYVKPNNIINEEHPESVLLKSKLKFVNDTNGKNYMILSEDVKVCTTNDQIITFTKENCTEDIHQCNVYMFV